MKIEKCVAREVLDSRGFPTVEVELFSGHLKASAIVPSGASTGEGEALELRDGDPKRYHGKGVLKAVSHVEKEIAPAILGKEFVRQAIFDDLLCDLDGTPNKSKFGANAILPVSMAFARLQSMITDTSGVSATALVQNISSIFGTQGVTLPVPLMNVFNGGKHADNGIAIQEFMIVPCGFDRFSESLRAGVEVFHQLKKILTKKGLTTAVGDEGGFAPNLSSNEEAIQEIIAAIDKAGYKPGKDIAIVLDPAASEFYQDGKYVLKADKCKLTSEEMVEYYEKLISKYPIISIEDALAENDWDGWQILTKRLGKKIQLTGDDIFVTNKKILAEGIEKKVGNSVLIKLNQIGTLTETLETVALAKKSNYTCVFSHRSGETEDSFLADVTVATNAGQLKTGAPARSERLAKYNQLMRIEEELGKKAIFNANLRW